MIKHHIEAGVSIFVHFPNNMILAGGLQRGHASSLSIDVVSLFAMEIVLVLTSRAKHKEFKNEWNIIQHCTELSDLKHIQITKH